jgi:Zn-dependent alcohol dehydrogenase
MPRNFGGRRLSDGSTPISLLDDDDDDDDEDKKRTPTPCFGNFFGQSSFARHAIVNRSCVVKVATNTNLALFAPLGCGISTGVGSVLNTLNVGEGSSLAVFGTGSVGLAAIMAGKMRKARVIVAVDLNQARLELARKLGATHLVHGGDEDVLLRVRQACSQGVAYAVDCTGSPKVIQTMMDCLATRGRAAQVGIPTPDKTVPINILQHLLNGREYVGCAGGDCVPSEMLPFLMQQQKAGNFPLEDIVSYYDVKDYAQAFEDARSGKVVKAVLKWT